MLEKWIVEANGIQTAQTIDIQTRWQVVANKDIYKKLKLLFSLIS